MLVTGPSICHVDRCPHGCTRETGCRGIATLKPKYVINSLRSAQISMRAAADHLERAKIEGRATELRDAARMIESWIAGLSELDPAVPVGMPSSPKPQAWTDPEKEPRFQPGEET